MMLIEPSRARLLWTGRDRLGVLGAAHAFAHLSRTRTPREIEDMLPTTSVGAASRGYADGTMSRSFTTCASSINATSKRSAQSDTLGPGS